MIFCLQNRFESSAEYLKWFGPLVVCEMHACICQIFNTVPVDNRASAAVPRPNAVPECSAMLEVCGMPLVPNGDMFKCVYSANFLGLR